MPELICVIDAGTTSTRALIFDKKLNIKGKGSQEFRQIYPRPGWVEHNPAEIWRATLKAISSALKSGRIKPSDIAAIGITNQRETTVLWERKNSRPVANAIVWQCRRTAGVCHDLKRKGYEKLFKKKTGLVLDPYFSGTKIQWLLNTVPGLRARANKGNIAFGTVDTWLLWNLTNGRAHATDVSNASRTLLMNLTTLDWDKQLMKILTIPRQILPEIRSSSEIYGRTKGLPMLPDGIPIAGIAGDQQSALFGQMCFDKGSAKCTFGTGSFLLMNIGEKPIFSRHGLITTVAWKIGDKTTYALEGSAFIAGAAVQWLRDSLGIISSSSEVEGLARSVKDSGGVVFVPALAGLGAPHWRPEARGIISGITRATTKAHLARATLEGIAFQNHDLLQAMKDDTGLRIKTLRVDGGACANNLLMQFQSDILNARIQRPHILEITALGAALLSGLGVGIWKNLDQLRKVGRIERTFNPSMPPSRRKAALLRWSINRDSAHLFSSINMPI